MKIYSGRLIFGLLLSITRLHADPNYTLNLSKQSAFISEPIVATLELRYTPEENITKIEPTALAMENFWIEDLNTSTQTTKTQIIQKYNYLIFAQKSGNLSIPSQSITVIQKNSTNYRNIAKSLYSQKHELIISSLPKMAQAIGSYTIKIDVDSNSTKSNQPIHASIIIEGVGNLEDIQSYSLGLKEQQVFATKPVIESKYINGQMHSKFIQRFTILSSKDFTIPSISFNYFDSLTKQVVRVTTDESEIKITDASNLFITLTNLIYLLIGFIVGVAALLFYLFIQRKKPSQPIVKSIKKTKSDKELYRLLLPYSQELQGTKHISNLEENIYANGKNKIKKRDIIADLSRYVI